MNHRSIRLVAATLLSVFALGCDDTDPISVPPEEILAVTPLFIGIDPGQTQQLTATLGGAPVAVSWESSNPAVATVSGTGLVTGLTAGFTAITATVTAAPEQKISSNITVLPLLGTGLTNNVPVTIASSGARFSTVLYRIFVPPGKTNLSVTLAGGSGDADIFVRRAIPPVTPTATSATGTYACSSENASNGELCSISNPATGTWYISVMVWDAYAGASLRATFTPP